LVEEKKHMLLILLLVVELELLSVEVPLYNSETTKRRCRAGETEYDN